MDTKIIFSIGSEDKENLNRLAKERRLALSSFCRLVLMDYFNECSQEAEKQD